MRREGQPFWCYKKMQQGALFTSCGDFEKAALVQPCL